MLAPKILVIDDEKNIRKTLGLVLEGEGYEVAAFGTANEGLEHLEAEGADLVILDIKLPGMTGVEALERIRSSGSDNKDIPIIMISGHASLSEAVDTVKKGATDFFEKPLDRDGILIRVANCLKQRKLAAQVRELKAEMDMSIILITHDLGVIAGISDNVMVMYGGRVCEYAPVHDLFKQPAHPYTRGLLRSVPRLDIAGSQRLTSIPGNPPNLQFLPSGCAYQERCDERLPVCSRQQPKLRTHAPGHLSACHLETGA